MIAKPHTLWTGVRMRLARAACNPDTPLINVHIPTVWNDTSAQALVELSKDADAVFLEKEADKWLDLFGDEESCLRRDLLMLLLTQRAAPTEDLWTGNLGKKPGFIINLERFSDFEKGFYADEYLSALRCLVESLRLLAEKSPLDTTPELPFVEQFSLLAPSLTKLTTSDTQDPNDSVGIIQLTNLDACLANLGLDYDSEQGRDAACGLASLATLAGREGCSNTNCLFTPISCQAIPELQQQATRIYEKSTFETNSGHKPVKIGFTVPNPVDALLGVESCGLAPIFSPLDSAGRLTTSTLNRFAHKGLTLEKALATFLAGGHPLSMSGLEAHHAMYDVLMELVDYMPQKPDDSPVSLKTTLSHLKRGVRRELPERHISLVKKVSINGHKLFIRTAEYEDGTLGEINMSFTRENTTVRALVECLGQAISIGLQYGVPLDSYIDMFAYTRFGVGGTIEGDSNIRYTTSILDYTFRNLSYTYLGKELPDIMHQMIEAQDSAPMLPLDLPDEERKAAQTGRQNRLRLVI